MPYKAGFVNIIGSPNVGKSTLMNALVGEKLSVITSKAQTTRHRIMGIVNGKDFQIVYSDTPGVIIPDYKLHENMMRSVKTAFIDADIILFVTDISKDTSRDEITMEKIKRTCYDGEQAKIPIFLLINKVDLVNKRLLEERIGYWEKVINSEGIIPVSALEKFNVGVVFDKIMENIPESPPYFPKEQLTDKPERFFVEEIIRGKIFQIYEKEIPYSTTVIVESFKEEKKIIRIRAEIIVERESQKRIIIGHKGQALKKTGTLARRDIEDFLQKKVYLELYAKVNKNWRNKENQLRRYGYDR